MKGHDPGQPVERLFPFALRSRIVMVGRDTLARSRKKLQFVLITRDLSEAGRARILGEFRHHPVVQLFTALELGRLLGTGGAKVVGFEKSDLAQSIYAELRAHRVKPGDRRSARKDRDDHSVSRRRS